MAFQDRRVLQGNETRHWDFCIPFLDKGRKPSGPLGTKRGPSPLASVQKEYAQACVLRKVSAYEMHMMASCIVQGILQILSGMVPSSALRYQRSKAKARPSEANAMDYLRRNLQGLPEKHPDGKIAKFILSRQADLWDIAAGTAFG